MLTVTQENHDAIREPKAYQVLNQTDISSFFFRVDQLYAFFLQWSPSLYDNQEEADAAGFVVVDKENIDIVDDHFEPHRRLSQSWKVRLLYVYLRFLEGGC